MIENTLNYLQEHSWVGLVFLIVLGTGIARFIAKKFFDRLAVRVGVLGTRTDLGLVAEYMFDDRDEQAFNTVFEHDLAFGTRWSLNDIADTQALLGVIWDVKTEEYIFRLEASRRLGETWTLLLEGRVFGGADEPDPDALFQSLLDTDNKTASLQRDDYVQLELTRYF